MRAVASALFLLITNVVGLAMGTPITGLISDLLHPMAGEESMRYSLLLITAVMPLLAAWCLHRAARSIEDDRARAHEHD